VTSIPRTPLALTILGLGGKVLKISLSISSYETDFSEDKRPNRTNLSLLLEILIARKSAGLSTEPGKQLINVGWLYRAMIFVEITDFVAQGIYLIRSKMPLILYIS
jgi:hypothetical protein